MLVLSEDDKHGLPCTLASYLEVEHVMTGPAISPVRCLALCRPSSLRTMRPLPTQSSKRTRKQHLEANLCSACARAAAPPARRQCGHDHNPKP